MENSGNNAELLSDPVPSSLIDADEPATAKPKAEGSNAAAKADPAPVADAEKTDTPDATDENAETDEAKKPSRRQRKLQLEREARAAAEARAEAAERALMEVRAKAAPAEPRIEDFASEAQWLRACQIYDREQASARQTQLAQTSDRTQERLAQDWLEREKDFVLDVPTYEKDVGEFVQREIQYFSQQAREEIVKLGPEVLHYLATNPDVADDIIELSPRRQVAALAKLDISKAVGLTDGDASDEGLEGARVPASKSIASRPDAPPPARHTRQGSTQPAGLSDDMDAYIAQRRKQGARWAR